MQQNGQMLLLKLLTVLYTGSMLGETARILVVIPTPSISHQVVFRPLTQELARRGHEVVVITTDPAFPKDQSPDRLTEIDIHDISYKAWREVIYSGTTQGKTDDTTSQIALMLKALTEIFETQMNTVEVQSLIRNSSSHFDLLMIESCTRYAISLKHVFKTTPVIRVSSLGAIYNDYDLVGAPTRPVLLYPTIYRQRLFNLSLWELYKHYAIESIFARQKEEDDRVIKRLFGPDTPTIEELESDLDMLFLNVHPIWEFNRPVPPNVIFMGGIHQKPPKELPEDLKTYLDSSKNGVIYISFGTNVSPSLLPPAKIQVLVRAFSELPYDVLWKWDKDVLPNRSKNIKISKWFPQSDLLKHPKIKVFITQGGLQSTEEAIRSGVPLIGMPMLVDQWFNVEQYLFHKIGIRLDLDTLTVEKLKEAIETLVSDESFRKNVARLRAIMDDQPQKPLERAIWWTEHVIRHGGASHLKALAANMPWGQYLDVELLSFLGLITLVVLVIVGYVVILLYHLLKMIFVKGSKLKIS